MSHSGMTCSPKEEIARELCRPVIDARFGSGAGLAHFFIAVMHNNFGLLLIELG